MRAVSLVGSVSRLAGGLFESVRRLHQELLGEGVKTLKREALQRATVWCDEIGPRGRPGKLTVEVLGLRDEFTETDLPAWRGVPVRTFKSFGLRSFGFAPGLARELILLKPELVHVHGLWQFSSLAAACWRRFTRRPCLVSPHGMLDDWAVRHAAWKKRLAWAVYERQHLRAAACIRALCEAEARSIRRLGLTNPICIIPNGVDLPAEPIALGAEPALAGRKVLLYLGRLHPKKGLCELLKAWAQLGSGHEWVLVVAGWDQDGHERELQELSNRLKLAWTNEVCEVFTAKNAKSTERGATTSLLFVGPQYGDAKRAWLARCDAFVIPSRSEGLPMAVLEAWAHTKPVLMTPQCNLPEGFASGSALPIDSHPESIAAGSKVLFGMNDEARERMGIRGRELVSQRFAWPQVAGELRGVYDWITGAGPQPGCVRTQD